MSNFISEAKKLPPRISLFGNSELIIEDYLKIHSIKENEIIIKTTIGALSVEGENLVVSKINDNVIGILGNISKICYI